MSLRVKMELLLVAIVGSIVALGYFFQQVVILPQFIPEERELATKEMQRSRNALASEIEAVDALCRDWATREETGRFVRGSAGDGGSFVPRALDHRLNFVCVLDREGRRVWEETVDYRTGDALDPGEFGAERWDTSHPLLAKDLNSGVAGLWPQGQRMLVLSARPILSREDEGGFGGTLILGRLLDNTLFREVSGQSSAMIYPWANWKSQFTESERMQMESPDGNPKLFQVRERGRDLLQVYSVYPDALGVPLALLTVNYSRGFIPVLQDAVAQNLIVQLSMVLVGLALVVVAFRSFVMTPLGRLTSYATQIASTQDLSSRIEMERNDEFGVLAREINTMVERLEKGREARQKAEEALRESEERYALAVKGSNEGLWDWNLKTDEIYYSTRWKSLLGYEEEELANSPDTWFELVHPEDMPKLRANIDAHLAGQTDHFECEYRMRHRDDTYVWMLARGLAVRDTDGRPVRMAGSQADITGRKSAEMQLTHRALHDALTNLPNRVLMLDRLRQAIRYAERRGDFKFAVMFLDLDRFKVINDSLGHVLGDQLLMSFAKKLQKAIRATDTVTRYSGTLARFGGDEFVVLLEDLRDVEDANVVAVRIQKALEEPFRVGPHEVFTTASIGIATSTEKWAEPEDYLRAADTAMYRAKARGRACHVVYDSSMYEQALGRMQVETDLRHVVDRNELMVYYQPIVSLQTGRITAFEALVRWQHPKRGIVPPSEFVPVAEDMGLITAIGKWVLGEACGQVVQWQDRHRHVNGLAVSVNVSVRQFSDPYLVDSIQDVLRRTSLNPEHLKLEITESVIMENVDLVTETLDRLRALNLKLSLDDFGTGYSSLSYLHRFPMNVLKIDQSFVRNVAASKENFQLVKTILMLARNFEMSTVAEGVESREQIEVLRSLECDDGQGYYFARPLTREHAEELLASNPTW